MHVHVLPFAEKYLKELVPQEQAMIVGDIEDIQNEEYQNHREGPEVAHA